MNKDARPNVVVFCTDQQRADSLGCMGNAVARTPNIDALAAAGVLYRRHYTVNPVCMPSRAAFVTGCYPQTTGLLANGLSLREDLATMPGVFRAAGYRTASFGKLHFQPYLHYEGSPSKEDMNKFKSGELDGWNGPYYGFEHVEITTSHGNNPNGNHYTQWRAKHYPDTPFDGDPAYPAVPSEQCHVSRLPVEAHASTWVADRAIAYLNDAAKGGQPFYLNVSFPDPHHPFSPPLPWGPMFDDAPIPLPHRVEGENESKPGPWRLGMTGYPFSKGGDAKYYPKLTDRELHLIRARTYAMVSLIDHSVGRVTAALRELGLTGNTIVVFTSDHGDFLGDHWFLYKGEIPARALLHVPLIVSDPRAARGAVDEVVSNIDVMPTLLTRCGLEAPSSVQGVALPGVGQAPLRDYAYEAAFMHVGMKWHHHSLYTRDWKIAFWTTLADGELYYLRSDPMVHRYLFNDPGHRATRSELIEKLFAAAGAAEPRERALPTLW